METREIKINVPEGYEIDKENSTFECVKFKKKEEEKPWRNNQENIVNGYLHHDGRLVEGFPIKNTIYSHSLYATQKQAKSALAMAQISQIMANDKRFGGRITDEEWEDSTIRKWIIRRMRNNILTENIYSYYFFLAFHTEEQLHLFIKENEDLIKDYLMLD